MMVVCPKCSLRLQAGGNEPLTHPFTVRCPKCNSVVNSEPPNPASVQSALTVGDSPATEHHGRKTSQRALSETGAETNSNFIESWPLTRTLMAPGQRRNMQLATSSRPSWNPRKILICAGEQYRQHLASQLSQKGNQVFVAQDTRQAVERMRENRLDVVLLDQDFDAAEQGAAFVTREVTILRPAQRRRLFFVLLSPVLRTMEAHAAFSSTSTQS